MKSTKYLQSVADKFGLTTKTAVAEKLGLSKQAVSNYLSETRVMDEETCLAVALALDINPVEVMMAAGIDRAEKTGQKSLWEVFSRRTATAASVALLASVVSLFVTPTPSEATPLLKINSGSVSIMLNRRRRLTAMLAIRARLYRILFSTTLQPTTR